MDNEELTCKCGCRRWLITDAYVKCCDCQHEIYLIDISKLNRRLREDAEDEV